MIIFFGKGGIGSGNFDHAGLPGRRGGSAPKSPPKGTAFYSGSGYITESVRTMIKTPVRNLQPNNYTELENEISRVYQESYPDEKHYDYVLAALEKEKGFSGLPSIISNEDALAIYEETTKSGQRGKLDPDNVILFRGVKDKENTGMVEDMRTGNHYVGWGAYGNGMYTSGLKTATSYSDKKNIQPIFIGRDTKLADYKDFQSSKDLIVESLTKEVEAIESEHLRTNSSLDNLDNPVWVEKKVSLMLTASENNSRWAVINNYDGFYVQNIGGSFEPTINIFNRSKLRMTNSTVSAFPEDILNALRGNSGLPYYDSLRPNESYLPNN